MLIKCRHSNFTLKYKLSYILPAIELHDYGISLKNKTNGYLKNYNYLSR